MTQTTNQENGAEGEVVVGSYDTYREAANAAELLKNLRIPDQYRSIVPRDIVLVERGSAMNYGKAALFGASLGALFGLLVGIVSGAFDWVTPAIAHVWAATIAVICGAVFGAATGVLAHWASQPTETQRRERWEAGHYDVVTNEANADEARRALQGKVGASA
jgi:hypothetical protein